MRFPKSPKEARVWKNKFLNQLKELEDKDKILNVLKYHDFKYYEEFTYLQESIKELSKKWITFLFLLNECWEIFYKLKDKDKTKHLVKSFKNNVYCLKYEIYIPKEGITGRSYIVYMNNFIELNIKCMIKLNIKKMISAYHIPVCE